MLWHDRRRDRHLSCAGAYQKDQAQGDKIMKEQIITSIMRERAGEGLIGTSPVFVDLMEQLKQVADKKISILLLGETGTGKSRCAEFIHHYSHRFQGPFIVYNCGACPDSLFESQLFGHRRGAFTGALEDRVGLVEDAHTGTLVLDEVNSLAFASQVKLNHFLETGSFRRVGENRLRQADVRIIAAANTDLKTEVAHGRFREDLYYRLSDYEITLPSLRERLEDIDLLIEYFKNKYSYLNPNARLSWNGKKKESILSFRWPGNIRELESYIKRCIIDAADCALERKTTPLHNTSTNLPPAAEEENLLQGMKWKMAKKHVITRFEIRYLQCLLIKYHGIVVRCARHAGMQPADFWKMLKKYELNVQEYRV
jgi:DNA-binding NtrC family response regulator